ncbi:MAG: DivIVA domain-containing protein, partial [Ruthenibacterium sp.]
MMTVGDIHNVTFEKAMLGYRSEDVDDFLTKVAQDFELLLQERDDAINEREASAAAAAQEKETL